MPILPFLTRKQNLNNTLKSKEECIKIITDKINENAISIEDLNKFVKLICNPSDLKAALLFL